MKKSIVLKYKYLLIVTSIIIIYFNSSIANSIISENSSIIFNEEIKSIEFNCKNTSNIIKPFSEINCGPINLVEGGTDLTEQYRQIGIRFIRTHDFSGPTDISTIFPNWNKSAYDEDSYNFTSSDEVISTIVNCGAKVFYRLGESASTNKSLRNIPPDFFKWAEICKHIVMHYNDGWNNGFYYNITHWEIWNEPDLQGFWNGSPQEYYQLYNITSNKLKKYNQSLKIGGPCTSSIDNLNFTSCFLDYMVNENLSLDFYSWHRYTNSPYELYKGSIFIRNLLDSYGFTSCENINTEWNYDILSPQRDKDNAKNAAFTASSLILLQDSGLDYAFRYRGTQDNSWFGRLLGFDLSLFSFNGLYKTPALVYRAFNYLINDSQVRILPSLQEVNDGIQYIAGISDDGKNITIFLSNFENSDTTIQMSIYNLPWHKSFRVVDYLINDISHLDIISDETYDQNLLNYTLSLDSNTVHFIRLTNSSIIPDEVASVATIPIILQLKILDPFIRIIAILMFLTLFG
jgi:hypothetical protein